MSIATGLFLIFTQFYTPYTCNNKFGNPSCIIASNVDINFSIHGLWPEYSNNSYPSYCNKSAVFNITTLKPYLYDLNVYWLSFEGPNQDFWKHEYLKHATCFPEVTESEFFNKTLNLYHQMDTTTKMKKADIMYDYAYDKTKMQSLFYGVFTCDNTKKQVVQYMSCYDVKLNRLQCPNWLEENSCGDKITFHSW